MLDENEFLSPYGIRAVSRIIETTLACRSTGDDGFGVGASHQTGWTGLVAKLLQQSGE